MLIGYKKDNLGEVVWWKSTNGEKNFTKTKVLISENKSNFDLSSMVRNANSEAKIIVVKKVRNQFAKMYLLGENRPVERTGN